MPTSGLTPLTLRTDPSAAGLVRYYAYQTRARLQTGQEVAVTAGLAFHFANALLHPRPHVLTGLRATRWDNVIGEIRPADPTRSSQ